MRPEVPDPRLQRGVAAHQRGDLDAAEQEYRALLAEMPQHPDATHFLGLLLHQRGRSEDALPLLRAALTLAPGSHLYRGNLAGVLQRLGDSAAAERLYREALALNPGYLGGHISLGLLYAGQGDHPRALAEFDAALALDPANFDAWFNRAHSLIQLARLPEAREAYGEAAGAAGNDVDRLLGVASALREAGEVEAARRCHERALELAPGYPPAENSLGNLLGMVGDLAGAERHYRRALELKPDYAGAYHNLLDVARIAPDDATWASLMRLADRSGTLPPADEIALQFALGRAFEGQKDYARAFGHFQQGNRLKRATLNYDEARQARFFKDFARVFDADFIASHRLATADTRPVFIVGMPRSGTTLVEQILASHSEVRGAGETHALRNSLREELPPDAGDYGLPEALAGQDAAAFARAAARYGRYLDAVAPGAARVTNKLPGNMVFVGLVSLLYPEARIVHCSREPLDTCLSCYTKLFTTGHPFAYEQMELGRFHRMYQELMHHWQTALPGRMLELRYEELVADVEGQARRLVAHLGLPWDEACLRFHESSRAVRTASLAQVRKPIYANSVGRWKLYEKELAPLKAALMGS
ncbi:MAG TPA: sulfotransferase [Gammaproteobacteria bacterium]